MTRDEIIRMAREAAARHGHTLKEQPAPETVEFITELAAMAAAAEREACVRLCESGPERQESNGVWVVDHWSCAEALRTRGQQ